MKLEEQSVLFRDRNDREMRVESTEVFLIIEGKLQARTEKEVETTTMKFSVPATILSGGIPVWRKVKEKKSASSLHSEFFMRLYNRMSAEPSVEILQYAFDYSFLAAEMTPNSVANFNTTVTKIRDSFPQAIFDDRLTAPFTIDILTTEPQDIVGIDCKLLYLYHRTVSNHSSSA
jgi:hypothetical protein